MDKPSDAILRPFVLPTDEAQIEADWAREHPEEAKMLGQYPGDRSPEERRAERFEAAHREKERVMQDEGFPASSWGQHDVDLPASSAEQAKADERCEQRRMVRGGLSDSPEDMPARATEGGRRPFRV